MDTRIVDPLVAFVIKLPRAYTLRVMVWSCKEDMEAGTPEESDKSFAAIFIPASSRCIGTLHLSACDISNGTRAHEILHAVDDYSTRAFNEERARVCEKVTNEIDAVLMGLRG